MRFFIFRWCCRLSFRSTENIKSEKRVRVCDLPKESQFLRRFPLKSVGSFDPSQDCALLVRI